jgi:hypothetical protein
MQTAPEVFLFLDDHGLRNIRNLRRRFYSPQKSPNNPLLFSGQAPWEETPLLFGSVRFDPFVKKFRMWYYGVKNPETGKPASYPSSLALAESKDMVHWTRPVFDITPFNCNGKKIKTNIVFQSTPDEGYIEAGSVLINSRAASSKRYLLVYCAREAANLHNRYYRLAWSPDGLHWSPGSRIPINPPARVDRHTLLQDPITGEYLFYCRGQRPFPKKFPTVDIYDRTVCFQTSSDLEHWSRSREVLAADKNDPPYTNIYSLMPFFRGTTLLGIRQLHFPHKDNEVVTTQLAWSHDKTRWNREVSEFIPLGTPGDWDRFNNAVADAPVIHNDTMYFFYSGRLHRHSGYEPKSAPDSGPPTGGIGLATLPLDRFAALEASFDTGSLTTKPMLWPKGKKLHLNADAQWGKIEVEIVTSEKTVTAQLDSQSGIKLPVALPKIPNNQSFHLKITITNARLYALYWL